MKKKLSVVASAYNESSNINQFVQRVFSALLQVQRIADFPVSYQLIIADNNSQDNTRNLILQMQDTYPHLVLIANKLNYGPEASVINALKYSVESDYIALICSDLQDPPEYLVEMFSTIISSDLSAVIAVKKTTSSPLPMRFVRRSYYSLLDFASRRSTVPPGFHGFGVYTSSTIKSAISIWCDVGLNLRQCLVYCSQPYSLFSYNQAARVGGTSTYNIVRYLSEALRAISQSDATSSRTALLFCFLGACLFLSVGIFIIGIRTFHIADYASGITTLILIVLFAFTIQSLLIGLLSRQIEMLRISTNNSNVNHNVYKSPSYSSF